MAFRRSSVRSRSAPPSLLLLLSGRSRGVCVLASAEMEAPEELHPAVRGLKTVCRCNNIKLRTIERAIRDGAYTMTQVSARTTATMGQCGGSCTPDVQALLDELAPKHAAVPAPVPEAEAWWVRKK